MISMRKLFWKAGFDICKFTPSNHPIARSRRLFQTNNIDVVLDIGANTGQFADHVRNKVGYSKRILSFEPLSSAFKILKKNAENDPRWEVFNFAIGSIEGRNEINIASNSFCSSLLNASTLLIQSLPGFEYVGKELVEIKTLDSILPGLCNSADNIYLKIDTQGFENEVLKGANQSLKYIDFVQMELSLNPLYEGETLFNDMCIKMAKMGYSMIGIEPVYSDRNTGQLLQVDGIFQATELLYLR